VGGIVQEAESAPKILVFSTDPISDPGIDMAGGTHQHYSPSVLIMSVPCSSSIRPSWILYALQKGFDGVFIAADGLDCAATPDCTKLTGNIISATKKLLKKHNISAKRIKMAAICSVCSESFVGHMDTFAANLDKQNKDEAEEAATAPVEATVPARTAESVKDVQKVSGGEAKDEVS
jgi:coenzyme F420-reducing hydrogenase delta subunit